MAATRPGRIPIRAWDSIRRSSSARISTSPAARLRPIRRTVDCSLPGIPTLSSGFPANSLTDPEPPPLFFSLDPKLVTPYMQQWHLSTQYELPSNTVFEVTYAGSRGLKQYIYLNGNQAAPNPDPNLPFADRRPLPQLDGFIGWFRSAGLLELQLAADPGREALLARTDVPGVLHLGARAGHRVERRPGGAEWRRLPLFQRSPGRNTATRISTSAIALSSATCTSFPIGHGKRMLGDASGVLNQIVGGWQVGGITSVSSGNWFTILDDNGVANSDGQQRPDLIGDPAGHALRAEYLLQHLRVCRSAVGIVWRRQPQQRARAGLPDLGFLSYSRTSRSPSAPSWSFVLSSLTCSIIPIFNLPSPGRKTRSTRRHLARRSLDS